MNNASEFTDEYVLKLQDKYNKQKEVLDKIKEIVNKVDFEMGDFPELELAGDILDLLEDLDE